MSYPCKFKIAKYTPRNPSCHTSVLDLSRPGIRMHLRELELGLHAHTLGERCISDCITERLSKDGKKNHIN
jgi:hypothetical protein